MQKFRSLSKKRRGHWTLKKFGDICLNQPVSEYERPANNYRSRKRNRIFQHFGRLFLLGTLKNVPCPLNELLVNFREESSGIRRFCRLEFQRMANWPSFDKRIETGKIIRHRRPLSCNSPCFDKKNRNWASCQLAIRWNFEPAKSANPTRFLPKIDQQLIETAGDIF